MKRLSQLSRVLVEVGKDKKNLLLMVAALHGNEQGSIHAAQNVYQKITNQGIELNGTWVVLLGNQKAIQKNKRFLNKDLNRMWSKDGKTDEMLAETEELIELKSVISKFQSQAESKFFADLHATSGEDGIFVLVEEEQLPKLSQTQFKAPIVVADDNMLKNTLLRYMTDQGFVSLAFEGGQIGTREEVENHEFFIWKMLEFSGLLSQSPMSDNAKLDRFSKSLPVCFGFDYAHKISVQGSYKMKLGFKNFSFVEKDQVLGWELQTGEVRAKQSGYLLMPLYQETGYEGFFIISERALFQKE
jgi:succinylglutamate desuccinylase